MCSHYMLIDLDCPHFSHLALSNDLQVHFCLKNPYHNGSTRYSYVKTCMSIWWFFNHIGCCGCFKLLHIYNNDCSNYLNTNIYCILYYLRLKNVYPWPQSVHKNGITSIYTRSRPLSTIIVLLWKNRICQALMNN